MAECAPPSSRLFYGELTHDICPAIHQNIMGKTTKMIVSIKDAHHC